MISQFLYVRSARTRTLTGRFLGQFLGVALLGLLTAACAATPERLQASADPSDPAVRVPSASYRPVLGGYVSQRPVTPAPWREQNERVAPAQKQ